MAIPKSLIPNLFIIEGCYWYNGIEKIRSILIQVSESYVLSVPVIKLLPLSSKSILDCLACDTGAESYKYFSLSSWQDGKFASRGTLMDTVGGRAFSFRFWCALFFFLLDSTLFSWRVGHPTELTPSEFPWHTHGHLPRKFCRLHKAASQQVQQHPQWVTSNKSKNCALLKCTKNSY